MADMSETDHNEELIPEEDIVPTFLATCAGEGIKLGWEKPPPGEISVAASPHYQYLLNQRRTHTPKVWTLPPRKANNLIRWGGSTPIEFRGEPCEPTEEELEECRKLVREMEDEDDPLANLDLGQSDAT